MSGSGKRARVRCEVLLFAQLAEAVGSERLMVSLERGGTVGEALAQLAASYEAIASMRDRIAVAVDERYATADTPLRDGATMALLPPISGG